MRIVHLCLSCFYIDGAGYQENYLVRQHVRDGHEVLVIASTETFDERGGLVYAEPSAYVGLDGANVIRLPYSKWFPHGLAKKLRIHPNVYKLLKDAQPDAILYHGSSGNEIVTVAKYVRDYPKVLLYTDSHADNNNSARGFISRYFLHGLFYRSRLNRALPQIRKILCVSVEAMDFLSKLYGVDEKHLEFFPLGGFVLEEQDIVRRRSQTRAELGFNEDMCVFIQTGKMTARKKLVQTLGVFSRLPGENLRFLVVGLLGEDTREEVASLIEADPRVKFLGWKSPEDLDNLLCAADAYVQPGSQSATMQNALCCGCPVIIDNVRSHQPYLSSGAILVEDENTLSEAFMRAMQWNRSEKRGQALVFARKHLDYVQLSKRVTQE